MKTTMEKNNKKTYSQRFIIGLKHGWNTPMMPPKVIAFNNYPLVRIFRVIGGLSVLMVLLKKHLLLLLPLQYLILFIAILHISYFVTINLIKVFYGTYKLWRGDLNIRNSPLDRLASLGGNLLYCWKVGCYVASSGISLAGASVVADTILEAGGQERVFTPLLGKGVKLWVKGKPVDTLFTEINSDIKNLKTSKDRFEELRKLVEDYNWDSDKAISKEDSEAIKSALEEAKKMEKSELQARAKILAKKIREYSNENNK
jgi:hypothetical protein